MLLILWKEPVRGIDSDTHARIKRSISDRKGNADEYDIVSNIKALNGSCVHFNVFISSTHKVISQRVNLGVEQGPRCGACVPKLNSWIFFLVSCDWRDGADSTVMWAYYTRGQQKQLTVTIDVKLILHQLRKMFTKVKNNAENKLVCTYFTNYIHHFARIY